MSRSKQLGGFPTSGVFGFRQTQARAPRSLVTPVNEFPTGGPAPSALSVAAMSISFPTP